MKTEEFFINEHDITVKEVDSLKEKVKNLENKIENLEFKLYKTIDVVAKLNTSINKLNKK